MTMRPVAVRLLGTSLLVGAAYDVFFGLGALYFPQLLADWIGFTLPSDRLFLAFSGVLLLILAGFYVVSARVIRRAPELAAMAAAGRFLGFLFFLRLWFSGYPVIYLLFGVIDLLFALAHAGLLSWALRGAEAPLEAGESEVGS